jgi:hypothetical protein
VKSAERTVSGSDASYTRRAGRCLRMRNVISGFRGQLLIAELNTARTAICAIEKRP